jgi:hypothetical protein
VVGFAAELGGGMGEETQVGNRAGNLGIVRQCVRLAAIQRFGPGEFLQPCLQRGGQFFQPRCAFGIAQSRPRGKGAFCSGNRRFDIGGIASSDPCKRIAGSRIDYVQPAAAGRGPCFAVYPVGQGMRIA